MLQLLAGFAALSLITGALMNLLPDGSLRHAASMTVGLVMLLYWAQGVQDFLANIPPSLTMPLSVLSTTGVNLHDVEASLMQEETP